MPASLVCKKSGTDQSFQTSQLLVRHLRLDHEFMRYKRAAKCVECERKYSSYCGFSKHYSRCSEATIPFPENLADVTDTLSVFGGSHREEKDVRSPSPALLGLNDVNPGELLRKESANFLAYLNSQVSLLRNQIQNVVSAAAGLSETIFDILTNHLKKFDPDETIQEHISPLLDILRSPFTSLQTAQQRLNYFEREGAYIPPQEFVIGQRRDQKRKQGKLIFLSVQATAQYISLKKTLHKFFSQGGNLQKC